MTAATRSCDTMGCNKKGGLQQQRSKNVAYARINDDLVVGTENKCGALNVGCLRDSGI